MAPLGVLVGPSSFNRGLLWLVNPGQMLIGDCPIHQGILHLSRQQNSTKGEPVQSPVFHRRVRVMGLRGRVTFCCTIAAIGCHVSLDMGFQKGRAIASLGGRPCGKCCLETILFTHSEKLTGFPGFGTFLRKGLLKGKAEVQAYITSK